MHDEFTIPNREDVVNTVGLRNILITLGSDGGKMYPVEMSYGFKLLLEELKALGIVAKLKLVDKV